jgi:cardiolipin synthase A/B
MSPEESPLAASGVARSLVWAKFTQGMKKGLLPFAIVLVVLFTGCRTPQPQLTRPIQVTASVTNRVFLASLAGQLGHSFLPGNRLEPLQNGAEFVPAMLAAIRSASNSVNLEVFIWRSGRMSEEFIAALTERARAGVEVRVVADALGTLKFKDEDQQRLRAAGVQFVRYNKPRLWRLDRLNFRDHRKLLIVDGNVGFTGGMCIADEWLGNAETKDRWRYTQV